MLSSSSLLSNSTLVEIIILRLRRRQWCYFCKLDFYRFHGEFEFNESFQLITADYVAWTPLSFCFLLLPTFILAIICFESIIERVVRIGQILILDVKLCTM